MDIVQIVDCKFCFKTLGYAIVEQAFEDYKKDLEFIKKWKNNLYIIQYPVTKTMLNKFRLKHSLSNKTDKQLTDLFIKNKKLKLKQTLDDLKDINKFVMSDWYEILCPIIDKRIAREQLESMEKEILGNEIYLLN